LRAFFSRAASSGLRLGTGGWALFSGAAVVSAGAEDLRESGGFVISTHLSQESHVKQDGVIVPCFTRNYWKFLLILICYQHSYEGQ
jgi:hypothetical protein